MFDMQEMHVMCGPGQVSPSWCEVEMGEIKLLHPEQLGPRLSHKLCVC